MPAKALAAFLFGGVFGITFIVVGIRRMLGATRGKGVADSLLWGSIGILIGLGFFYAIYWMMTPPANDRQLLPFEEHSHP